MLHDELTCAVPPYRVQHHLDVHEEAMRQSKKAPRKSGSLRIMPGAFSRASHSVMRNSAASCRWMPPAGHGWLSAARTLNDCTMAIRLGAGQ